jgi:hypothetical protein
MLLAGLVPCCAAPHEALHVDSPFFIFSLNAHRQNHPGDLPAAAPHLADLQREDPADHRARASLDQLCCGQYAVLCGQQGAVPPHHVPAVSLSVLSVELRSPLSTVRMVVLSCVLCVLCGQQGTVPPHHVPAVSIPVMYTCYAFAACVTACKRSHCALGTTMLWVECAARAPRLLETAVGPLCLPRAHSVSFVPHLSWLVCAVPSLCTALRC